MSDVHQDVPRRVETAGVAKCAWCGDVIYRERIVETLEDGEVISRRRVVVGSYWTDDKTTAPVPFCPRCTQDPDLKE